MKIEFYTPAHGVCADSFGGATFGFVGSFDPKVTASVTLPYDLEGVMVSGSYDECLAQLPKVKCQAAIVMLGNAGGENDFISRLAAKIKAPIVGGGAAIHPDTGETGLITGKGQAAVFLITDTRYDYEVCCENIHKNVLSAHEITFTDPRCADQIDGVDAAVWLANKKAEIGLPADDFEHLTLSDLNGVNAHLSCVDGKICSGRDLQERMLLRYVLRDRVFDRMQKFYDDPNAVVFGCAGLKGILPRPIFGKGIGLFMFGEVCTLNGVSEFGNLMLSKLRILPK